MDHLFERLYILWKKYNPEREWVWILNFSGGKDSSLLLASTIEFLERRGTSPDRLFVVHEDTSAELPLLRELVKQTLAWVNKVGAHTVILEAEENFFTYMLRHGYSFPRWNFRWCCRVYKYGKAKHFIKSLPYGKILNLIAIRGDEKRRLKGRWITEKKVDNKNVVTASPMIDLKVNDVWLLLEKRYKEFHQRLKCVYTVKADGLGCWTCTVVAKDLATLALDPHLYELKLKLCLARCTNLRIFQRVLEVAVKERPEAFPNFHWPDEERDVRCRGKCNRCPLKRLRYLNSKSII